MVCRLVFDQPLHHFKSLCKNKNATNAAQGFYATCRKGDRKHIFKKDITVGWAGGVKTVFNSERGKWLESDTIGLLSAGGFL